MFFQLNKNNNNPNYSSLLSIQALDGWMMDDELHSRSSIHIHRQLLLHLATDPKSASLPHQSQLSSIHPVHQQLELHRLPTILPANVYICAQKSTTKNYTYQSISIWP
jgi:hypothetical protein